MDPVADKDVLETQARLSGLGVLAAGVAHEMANPLGFVKSNTQYMRSAVRKLVEKLDEGEIASARKALEEIGGILDENLDGIRRLIEISSELRMVARSREDAGPCDVESALDRALLLTHNLLKYKADVRKDFGHPEPVIADEGKLTQVFVNLLANAAQAIVERGRVDVMTRADGSWTLVEIADTGSGISPDAMGRLFEPFFTTKPPGVGTGLGLWMARNIVEEAGGTIDVESEVGKGTRFSIRLPAADT